MRDLDVRDLNVRDLALLVCRVCCRRRRSPFAVTGDASLAESAAAADKDASLPMVPFLQLFRFATGMERALLVVASVCAFAQVRRRVGVCPQGFFFSFLAQMLRSKVESGDKFGVCRMSMQPTARIASTHTYLYHTAANTVIL